VRQGPGTNYAVVVQLVRGEVRPIVGRAGNAPWWVIEFPDETRGWVADVAVTVQGNTAVVPIIAPPALDGATPTPGAAWNPTPAANCPTATPATVTATATAVTPTGTPSPTPTATETAEATLTVTPTITATTSLASSEEATPADSDATETPPAPPEADEESVAAAAESDDPDPITAADSDTAAEAAATGEANGGGTSAALPIAGAIMIVLGAVGLFMMRRRG
jgi:hypothetical protein